MTKKIKVLQFITPSGFYGAERWVLALVNGLKNDSLIVDLVVTRESPKQDLSVASQFPKKNGGKVHYMDMSGAFDPRVIWKLCKLIKEFKIDIIHTHGYKSDIIGLFAARLCNIRCISTPHGFSEKIGFKLRTFIAIGTYFLRYFDMVCPLSKQLLLDLEEKRIPDRKIRFIQNGVDLDEIFQSLDPVLDGKPSNVEKPILGFVGQIIARKGVDQLIEVFQHVNSEKLNAELIVIGDGALKEEMKTRASKLKCHDQIAFLGFRTDRLALLTQFSVFVMTSSLEGIPRCIMEAMALGVPVVAYDIPGVDQLVIHGETGLLAEFGDIQGLANCCLKVLNDKDLRDFLIENAKVHVIKNFSNEFMAEEYVECYEKLIQGDRGDANLKELG